jgi:signal transduction histidine kinase
MKPYFKKAKRQIALLFSIAATGLIMSATLLTVLLVRYQMDRRAETILTQNMNELLADYGVEPLAEKSVKFQYDTSRSSSAGSEAQNQSDDEDTNTQEADKTERSAKESLPNVITQKNLPNDDTSSEDIQEVQENRNVYTRVIDPEGYVLYTSDLFNNFSVDFNIAGFNKIETMDTCIYSYTSKINSGEYQDTTLQTAQFCQITPRQQMRLGFIMLAIALIASIAAYIIGLITAKYLHKPLQNSYNKTREFTQNVYHELLTPISVALSTAESSLKTRKYKKGIKSILSDLEKARKSLNFLGTKALSHQNKLSKENFDAVKKVKEIVSKVENNISREDITVEYNSSNRTHFQTDLKAFKLIIRNLIENAYKYSAQDGLISINIKPDSITVKNAIPETIKINKQKLLKKSYRADKSVDGSGLGLLIAKSLAHDLGWKFQVRIDKQNTNQIFIVRIKI